MNALGIALLWCIVQVTLVGLLAAGLYLVVRRFRPAAAVPVVLAALAMVVILSLLVTSPWPRWLAQDSATPPSGASSSAPGAWAKAQRWPSADGPGASLRSSPSHAVESNDSDVTARPSSSAIFWQALLEELSRPQPAAEPTAWRWPAVVAIAFVVAMLLGLGRLALGVAAVRREQFRSRPVTDRRLLELVDMFRAELGCRRTVEVRQCDHLATAATIGWRRPVLLVPSDWTTWTADECRAVLAHELAHVRSHDCSFILFGQLGLALHFYHPLIHWLAGRLRLEQELAADAAAARVSGGQRAYLMTIARLALRQQDRPLPWPARTFLPTRTTFLRRIAMLRDSKMNFRRLSPAARAVVIGMILLGGLLAAGLRGPGWHTQARAEEPAKATTDPMAADKPEMMSAITTIDLSLIPSSCKMFLAVRPAEALAKPGMGPMAELLESLHKTAPALGKMKLADFRQITIILPDPEPRSGLTDIVVFRSVKPLVATVIPAVALQIEKDLDGKKLYTAANGNNAILQYDDRTIIVAGSEQTMRAYLASNLGVRPDWLPKETWDAYRTDDAVLAYHMPALRRQIQQAAEYSGERGPALLHTMLLTLSPLWEGSKCVIGGVHVDEVIQMHATALAKDEKDAQTIEKTVEAARVLVRNAFDQAEKVASPGAPLKTLAAPVKSLLDSIRIMREGIAIRAEGSIPLAVIEKLQSSLLKAQQSSEQMVSAKNLKILAMAMHIYDAAHGHLPLAVLYGPDGKTPYSTVGQAPRA